ncbi:folate-binding protein [Kaistia algarum]|nr:folate-binding protein [Kaistia algarum]
MPMRNGCSAQLPDRAVVRITGADAEGFLQNIVTPDMAPIQPGRAGFGALLSPQGKILCDFILFPIEGGYRLDLPASQRADFLKRMTLYRLRAKIDIADESETHQVVAFWGGEAPAVPGALPDPRLAALGWRAIATKDADFIGSDGEAAYHAHRIALGVPEGGRDFAYGDAFPHDADMDDLGGLDFRKGCYVGQEIVSRMQHRGTARRRAVKVTAGAPLPPAGTSIEAGGKPIGTLGSSAGGDGIALLRLDRARRALDDGLALTADGVELMPTLPVFARFTWPTSGSEDEGAA